MGENEKRQQQGQGNMGQGGEQKKPDMGTPQDATKKSGDSGIPAGQSGGLDQDERRKREQERKDADLGKKE